MSLSDVPAAVKITHSNVVIEICMLDGELLRLILRISPAQLSGPCS